MGVSKVVYGNTPLLDVSGDTVAADKLYKGRTALGSDGENVVGTIPIGVVMSQTEYDNLSSAEKNDNTYHFVTNSNTPSGDSIGEAANSKVVYGDTTIIDVSGKNVSKKSLLTGYTAHGKNGGQFIGLAHGKVNIDAIAYDYLPSSTKQNGDYYYVKNSNYVPLNYIQGVEGAYIDTGIYGNDESKIEVDFEVNDANSLGICGSRKDSTTKTQLVVAIWRYATPVAQYGLVPLFADFVDYATSRANIDLNVYPLARYKIECSKSSRYIYDSSGNVLASNTHAETTKFTTPTTMKLFKADGFASNNVFKGKVYSYKHYKSNVLLQHMVPVKRKSDDKIGMLDIVNNVFYTSATNVNFLGG